MRLRTSVVVLHNDRLLTFLGEDPISKKEYHFLPGGKIEPQETAPEAAERETLEETGYRIKVETSSALDEEYDFFWNGKNYHCLTLFYRGHLTHPLQQPLPVQDAAYNKRVVWLPRQHIREYFNYHSVILEATLRLCAKD